MKKINAPLIDLMIVLNILLITTISCAQDSSAERVQEVTDNMKEELALTDSQYDSVFDINKKYMKKFEELRSEENPEPGKREEFVKMRNEWDKELEQVLTKEQFEKYQENNMKRRRKMMPNNR